MPNKAADLRSIPGSGRWRSCEPLTLGWSSDQKYVVAESGERLLLRLAAPDQAASKEAEYRFVERVGALGVRASRPVAFGQIGEGVYTLYSWIDGDSMETALPACSAAEQYALGLEAGRALRLIHSLPAPEGTPDWSIRMNRKIDHKISMAHQCPLEIPGRERMIDYIAAHRHRIDNRPQSMQHGDFHCGNLLLTPDRHVGVIDFNRFDAGDPWEEFNRIVWCAQVSPLFASGRINGYFPCGVPDGFFPLTAVYILSNQLSSMPWAIPFGEGEIEVMRRQAVEVLSWYDDCTRDVPRWYLPDDQARAQFPCLSPAADA